MSGRAGTERPRCNCRRPTARPRLSSHVLSSRRIILFTQLIPELVCNPISRHFILSCHFPGAPPVHDGMLRPQVPFSLFPALSPRGGGVPAARRNGGSGKERDGEGHGRGPTEVPPRQAMPLPSLAAYDSWCGVAHGCTRKIGLKICGKSSRGTPHPELRHASPTALRRGTNSSAPAPDAPASGSPWRAFAAPHCAPGALPDARARVGRPLPLRPSCGRRGAGSGAQREASGGLAASPSEIVQPYRSRK